MLDHWTWRLVICLAVLAPPGLALAQDDREAVKLSTEQINLNNRAVQLLSKEPPRTQEAISLVRAALVVGEKGDLLYLTLGRAYLLDGQCPEALEQFEQVERAPEVEGLPEEFIPIQLRKYRQELRDRCPGTLRVRCEPAGLELKLRGEALACGEPVELEAGTYEIEATNPDTGATVVIQAQVMGMEETSARIKLGQVAPPSVKVDEPDAPEGGGGAGGSDEGGEGGEDPVEPAPEPAPEEASGVDMEVAVGAPLGLCVARLTNDVTQAEATDAALCLGAGARLQARRMWGSFGIGGRARARGVVAIPLSVVEEPVGLSGGDVGLDGQMWMSRLFALELGGTWRPRRVQVDEETFGASPLMVGLGPRLALGEVISGVTQLDVWGRWSPLGTQVPLATFSTGLAVGLEGGLGLGLSYERWGGPTSRDQITHQVEQLLVQVRWGWSL